MTYRLPKEIKTSRDAYYYAKKKNKKLTKGAVSKLEELVSDSPMFSYFFLRDITKANMNTLQESIVKDSYWTYMAAKYIHKIDVSFLEKHMGEYLKRFHNEIIRDIIE